MESIIIILIIAVLALSIYTSLLIKQLKDQNELIEYYFNKEWWYKSTASYIEHLKKLIDKKNLQIKRLQSDLNSYYGKYFEENPEAKWTK